MPGPTITRERGPLPGLARSHGVEIAAIRLTLMPPKWRDDTVPRPRSRVG